MQRQKTEVVDLTGSDGLIDPCDMEKGMMMSKQQEIIDKNKNTNTSSLNPFIRKYSPGGSLMDQTQQTQSAVNEKEAMKALIIDFGADANSHTGRNSPQPLPSETANVGNNGQAGFVDLSGFDEEDIKRAQQLSLLRYAIIHC